MDYFPEVVQVIPHEDYTVEVYFQDGKIVLYDMAPNLNKGLFQRLKTIQTFMETCTVMNNTLAWDIDGMRDASKCIDIDPETLYELPAMDEKSACLYTVDCRIL